MKAIDLLRKFKKPLQKSSLLSLCKTFIKSRLGYANIIHGQAYNSTFHDKLESVQYNACLTIPGAIRGTSTENL